MKFNKRNMLSFKVFVITIILASLVVSHFADAAPASKKSRQHIKAKKSNNNNNKLKAPFKKAAPQPTVNRNAKMNLYNSRSWPSTNTFYHAATTPIFLRSAPTSMYYPSMRWSSPYLTSPSMMSNYLRRSDDFSSMPTMSTNAPMNSMMSMGGGQTPTLFDMSAFTGSGMMDNNYPSQSLWSMPEVSGSSGTKSKFNLFNSFSLNDDGLFGGLFNQFK